MAAKRTADRWTRAPPRPLCRSRDAPRAYQRRRGACRPLPGHRRARRSPGRSEVAGAHRHPALRAGERRRLCASAKTGSLSGDISKVRLQLPPQKLLRPAGRVTTTGAWPPRPPLSETGRKRQGRSARHARPTGHRTTQAHRPSRSARQMGGRPSPLTYYSISINIDRCRIMTCWPRGSNSAARHARRSR